MFLAENKDEFHQASVHRNKLLHRAVDVITGLQTDTDNLLVAADLHKDAEVDLLGSTPQTQFKITIGKSSPFKSSKPHAKEPSYEQAAFDAAQHRNALLQRAYSVISNLQVSMLAIPCQTAMTSGCHTRDLCKVLTLSQHRVVPQSSLSKTECHG